jgi:hypothetical protein
LASGLGLKVIDEGPLTVIDPTYGGHFGSCTTQSDADPTLFSPTFYFNLNNARRSYHRSAKITRTKLTSHYRQLNLKLFYFSTC